MKKTIRSFTLLYFIIHLSVKVICQPEVSRVFAGFEYIELAQNSFRNIGPENYTLLLGACFGPAEQTYWGIRYTGMQVELSERHLMEPSPVYKGNFTGVTGNLGVHRLYLDYYYRWDFGKVYIEPIVSLGIGTNRWQFQNRLVNENYDLKSLSLSLSGRFRFTFFKIPFIELGSLDAFGYIWKSREPDHKLGEAHIAFWKRGGLFHWMFIGCNFPIHSKG